MSTQEERLTTLERTVTALQRKVRDIEHNEAILLGMVSEQGKDIREVKVRITNLSNHLDDFEQSVNSRFESLEQNVNTRFETQDKKLDQVLLLLNTLTNKPNQGT